MGVFNVNVHYDVCFSYNIEAEDEDEAREIAERMAENDSDGEWDFTETNSYEYDEKEAKNVVIDNN